MASIIDKAIAFRNTHKFSAPTIFIGLGLLIFPLWGAFSGWPSVTAVFGYSFILVSCAYALWYFRKQLKLGTPWFYVPLFILLFLALLRFVIGSEPFGDKLLLSSYILLMVAFYFTAKQKGELLLWFVVLAIIVYSINAIVDAGLHLGVRARGLSTNPDTLAAMLMFCIFMLRGRWIWLAPLGVVAILLTGSYWAFGGLIVGGLVYIILNRKSFKWSNRLTRVSIVSMILAVIVVVAGISAGVGQRIWSLDRIVPVLQSANVQSLDVATYGRLTFYKYAFVDHFSWLGNGLNNVDNSPWIPGIGRMLIHNIPSMVMFELGPLALLIWLTTIGYGIWKSKRYRYVLVAIFALSVFGGSEFWQWTSFGSYYFLILGLVGSEIA